METKVLVTYASKYGATREIAEKISQTLSNNGLQVDTLPINQVTNLMQYNAVVLGSAIYMGLWRKKATAFLKANEKILAEKPVWLFSSGPAGEDSVEKILKDWQYPKNLQPIIDRIKPCNITVFHGLVDIEKMNFIEKWMVKKVKSPVGDYRDWNAIDSWALGIASVLKDGAK
jgi:menaquinone-dependent protoporphyrinogen oxidase